MKKVFAVILCNILGISLAITAVLLFQNKSSELLAVWEVFFVCWAVWAPHMIKELIEQLNQNEDKKENNDEKLE